MAPALQGRGGICLVSLAFLATCLVSLALLHYHTPPVAIKNRSGNTLWKQPNHPSDVRFLRDAEKWAMSRRTFREGRVDWHDLVNVTDPRLLQRAERETTSRLMAGEDLGPRRGSTHDPLRAYQVCTNDPCALHNTDRGTCQRSSFCQWCEPLEQCVDRFTRPSGRKGSMCPIDPEAERARKAAHPLHRDMCRHPGPVMMVGEARSGTEVMVPANDDLDGCDALVTEGSVVTAIPATAKMYYHWHSDYFEGFIKSLRVDGGLVDRDFHIIADFEPDNAPGGAFLQYYGILSNFCHRRLTDLPRGLCICTGREKSTLTYEERTKILLKWRPVEHIVHSLGLSAVVPSRPRVSIVARCDKRFILNEEELIRTVQSLDVSVRVLRFEKMSLFEQVKAMRETTVLVGMHGSGFVNAMYLPRHAVAWQLAPYHCRGTRGFFEKFCTRHGFGCKFVEWHNTNANHTVMHWHFLDPDANVLPPARPFGSEAYREKVRQSYGNPDTDPNTFFSFWINQDTTVDVPEFRAQLRDLLVWKETIHASLPRPFSPRMADLLARY